MTRGRATKLCTRLINKCGLRPCFGNVPFFLPPRKAFRFIGSVHIANTSGYVGFSFLVTSKARRNTETGMLFRCIIARDKNALK